MTADVDRRSYLGGHDMGAIVGVHPWLSAVTVQARKLGTEDEAEPTERMKLGLWLEDGIIAAWADRHPEYKVRRTGFVQHPRHPFLGGHPDRIVWGGPTKGILEVKASQSGGWGKDPAGNTVPPYVVVQAQYYAGLAKAHEIHVARLTGTSAVEVYRIPVDRELYGALVEEGRRWWDRHVIRREPVEPDGTEAYTRELRRRWPKDLGEEIVATPDQQLLARAYQRAASEAKAADRRKAEAQQRIETAMGVASSMVGPDFRITWRAGKGRTDWKSVASELLPPAELVEKHTGAGTRTFRAHFDDDPEEGTT